MSHLQSPVHTYPIADRPNNSPRGIQKRKARAPPKRTPAKAELQQGALQRLHPQYEVKSSKPRPGLQEKLKKKPQWCPHRRLKTQKGKTSFTRQTTLRGVRPEEATTIRRRKHRCPSPTQENTMQHPVKGATYPLTNTPPQDTAARSSHTSEKRQVLRQTTLGENTQPQQGIG
ncbi:Hypothetical predicted protein [Pelobates cultripes]|uniref:Uncharacterized protein n=1 Tax=Pelobates cultripes TaxID=61616 RepID=A0AAD1SPI4_PELCU|nr:Hypothetical predicted protein [Pelobates cultripes]